MLLLKKYNIRTKSNDSGYMSLKACILCHEDHSLKKLKFDRIPRWDNTWNIIVNYREVLDKKKMGF